MRAEQEAPYVYNYHKAPYFKAENCFFTQVLHYLAVVLQDKARVALNISTSCPGAHKGCLGPTKLAVSP